MVVFLVDMFSICITAPDNTCIIEAKCTPFLLKRIIEDVGYNPELNYKISYKDFKPFVFNTITQADLEHFIHTMVMSTHPFAESYTLIDDNEYNCFVKDYSEFVESTEVIEALYMLKSCITKDVNSVQSYIRLTGDVHKYFNDNNEFDKLLAVYWYINTSITDYLGTHSIHDICSHKLVLCFDDIMLVPENIIRMCKENKHVMATICNCLVKGDYSDTHRIASAIAKACSKSTAVKVSVI